MSCSNTKISRHGSAQAAGKGFVCQGFAVLTCFDVMLVACNRVLDRFFAKILDAASSCDEMALVVEQVDGGTLLGDGAGSEEFKRHRAFHAQLLV